MVKTKAPLFGFGASGKLGDAIVFGSWKGIDIAREYVVPANPNTAGQSTQRGYLTAAVAEWHTTGATALEAADKAAWNRLAGVLGRMSGFNAFARYWMNEAVAGGTPFGHFYNVDVTDATANSFDVDVDGDGLGVLATTLHLGNTKTFFSVEDTQNAIAGNAAFAAINTGFSAGETVYFWFEAGVAGATYARSGLYTTVLT